MNTVHPLFAGIDYCRYYDKYANPVCIVRSSGGDRVASSNYRKECIFCNLFETPIFTFLEKHYAFDLR